MPYSDIPTTFYLIVVFLFLIFYVTYKLYTDIKTERFNEISIKFQKLINDCHTLDIRLQGILNNLPLNQRGIMISRHGGNVNELLLLTIKTNLSRIVKVANNVIKEKLISYDVLHSLERDYYVQMFRTDELDKIKKTFE